VGDLTVAVTGEELLGLNALVEADRTSNNGDVDVETMARAVMDGGLKARLDEVGLPWAPSPEAAREAGLQSRDGGTDAAPEKGPLRALVDNGQARTGGGIALAIGLALVLWGGYAKGWSWTGFPSNKQLWDWLHLLLLPVAFATLPLWLRHREHISRNRQLSYLAAILAFAGFVAAGYLIPLNWTGFRGNHLWDWLTLIALPVTLISMRVWPTVDRTLLPQQVAAFAALAVGWVVTVIGGYALRWSWTGYQGNTLWDWLSLLLLPLVFPTILLPAASKWISGNAQQRAKAASNGSSAKA
jgi:hypothetical protein